MLLVDDEPMVLDALRRCLHQVRSRWTALCAPSGQQALEVLAAESVDVVVSDMRMETMNGAQLLAQVRRSYPGVARIILSGYADRNSVVQAVGPAQQFLTKPCAAEDLLAALDRVMALRNLVTDPHMRDLLGGVDALPAPPGIYQRLTEITSDPDYSLGDVIDVISADLATTTEVLRLANCSYFGLTAQVTSLQHAVSMLGLSTVQALAVSGAAYTTTRLPPGLDPVNLTSHGLHVAGLARHIAQADGWDAAAVADIFMAGLLHHIGLPVLATAHPRAWGTARADPMPDIWAEHEAYTRHFGCAPTQASAYLLGLWGFPDPVVRAIADQPTRPGDDSATLAGHLLSYARQRVHAPERAAPATPTAFLDDARLGRWETASLQH